MARKGAGFAQSGGINHTFGGGKGGTALSNGVTRGRRIASGRLNNGLNYNVRSEGGKLTLRSAKFHVGSPPPVRTGGIKTSRIRIRKSFTAGSK